MMHCINGINVTKLQKSLKRLSLHQNILKLLAQLCVMVSVDLSFYFVYTVCIGCCACHVKLLCIQYVYLYIGF